MGKLIFLDIDGTIRDFNGYIPPSTIEAITGARQNGHKLIVSTGRPLCQIEPKIMEIGFDGYISGSGSYVEYEGQCLLYEYFSSEEYHMIAQYLIDHDCIFQSQSFKYSCVLRNQIKAFEVHNEHLRQVLDEGADAMGPTPTYVDSLDEVETKEGIQGVEKIMYIGGHLPAEELQRQWKNQFYIVPLSMPTDDDWGGEISPATVNKGEGMKRIIAAAKDMSGTIAVGDSENDMEMIEMADVGIAMGNAVEAVKKCADVVTTDLLDDGLYQAFVQEGLLS